MTPPSAPAPRPPRAPRPLALAAAVALAACSVGDSLSEAPPGTVFVSIRDTGYQPDTVTITTGTSVRWTNAGAAQHNVASDAQLWASELLPNGWWFEVRFDSSGTFDYHCSAHAEAGTIIVQ